jgi:DNA polymerase III epsilon subunit-like protein
MIISLTDIETTGLDPFSDEIIEIGCVVFDSESLKIITTFDSKIAPTHIETASPRALEVNGFMAKDWKCAPSLPYVLTQYAALTQGTMFLAQNVMFDWSFLLAASKAQGIPLDFKRPSLDLPSIAFGKIPHARMQNWSLKTLCAYLGVPQEPKVHRGINGAMTAYEVYKALMKI